MANTGISFPQGSNIGANAPPVLFDPAGQGPGVSAQGTSLNFYSGSSGLLNATLDKNGALTCNGGLTVAASGSAPSASNFGDAAVTQATSVTTGVTINAASGVITTFSQSLAGASTTYSTFAVTNSVVTAASSVLVSIGDYAGTITTNGLPVVFVSNIAAGTFNINVANYHASNALSGLLKIKFLVC